jgi:TonB family protein
MREAVQEPTIAPSPRMSREPEVHLLLELEAEAARWRRRTMFLVSVMVHVFMITLLVVEPDIFRKGRTLFGLSVEPRPKPETTFLVLPPDLQRKLRQPPNTNRLSDKNRLAQGRSPVINPNGLQMPYSLGNTKLPEIAGGRPPQPPAASPTPPPGAASPPSSPPAVKKDEGLRLMDVQPERNNGEESNSRLQLSTPGEAIQQSLQAATRGRTSPGPVGPGNSTSQFENLNPNFSTEAPTILSDTRGVDFGPYLARIVYIVRRNWYAVIPESARLGEKGRVAIVFDILKDGSVPELRVVAGSGSDPLDRAAIAGIHASIPFPPLPEEFTGNYLRLQFIFLYNMGYGP